MRQWWPLYRGCPLVRMVSQKGFHCILNRKRKEKLSQELSLHPPPPTNNTPSYTLHTTH